MILAAGPPNRLIWPGRPTSFHFTVLSIFFPIFFTTSFQILIDLLFLTVWELQIDLSVGEHVFIHTSEGRNEGSESKLLCEPDEPPPG